jgi:hypothetical protein
MNKNINFIFLTACSARIDESFFCKSALENISFNSLVSNAC